MRWVNDAREDFWFGCRRLTRDLDATTAVVLVLACGIGLSVAMFAVADTVLRRPLPILDQERVVVLWGKRAGACARCRSPLSTSSAFDPKHEPSRKLPAP